MFFPSDCVRNFPVNITFTHMSSWCPLNTDWREFKTKSAVSRTPWCSERICFLPTKYHDNALPAIPLIDSVPCVYGEVARLLKLITDKTNKTKFFIIENTIYFIVQCTWINSCNILLSQNALKGRPKKIFFSMPCSHLCSFIKSIETRKFPEDEIFSRWL